MSYLSIGKVFKHPNGYDAYIESGYYLDPIYGRISNFWTWRPVRKNGALGKRISGYVWIGEISHRKVIINT